MKEAEVILEGKALEQVRDILAAHGVKHLYLENKAPLAYADRVRAALPGVEVDTGAVLSDAIDAIRAVKSEDVYKRQDPPRHAGGRDRRLGGQDQRHFRQFGR